jgi:hypothetical protein
MVNLAYRKEEDEDEAGHFGTLELVALSFAQRHIITEHR